MRSGFIKAILPLLMVALAMAQPPFDQALPVAAGDSLRIRFPGFGIIPPLLPGFPGIDPPNRKCAAACGTDCLSSRRNRVVFKSCMQTCLVRSCGVRISDVVYDCAENCANSISPNSFYEIEAQSFVTSCYNNCNKN